MTPDNQDGVTDAAAIRMPGDRKNARQYMALRRRESAKRIGNDGDWFIRLSTSAVTRTLLDADASRRRREEVVDKMAAAYILQGALDRLRNIR